MKRILVPVDFSENSINALKYAIDLVNMSNAELHITHSYHDSNKTGSFVSTQNKLREDTKNRLNQLVEKFQGFISSKKIIQQHFIRDYPAEGIAHVASKYQMDLIIMGTKGASGVKGAIWGSVASRLLNITKIPVLAVPKYFGDFKINYILLAVDNPTYDDKEILQPLEVLKDISKAEVTAFNMVVPIYAEVEDDQNVLEVSNTISEISDSYYQSFESNLKQGIIKYAMENRMDMICMIKRKRGFFIDIMHMSETKKIIFDSPVPLLVLQEK